MKCEASPSIGNCENAFDGDVAKGACLLSQPSLPKPSGMAKGLEPSGSLSSFLRRAAGASDPPVRADWVSSYDFGLTPALRKAWLAVTLSRPETVGVVGNGLPPTPPLASKPAEKSSTLPGCLAIPVVPLPSQPHASSR